MEHRIGEPWSEIRTDGATARPAVAAPTLVARLLHSLHQNREMSPRVRIVRDRGSQVLYIRSPLLCSISYWRPLYRAAIFCWLYTGQTNTRVIPAAWGLLVYYQSGGLIGPRNVQAFFFATKWNVWKSLDFFSYMNPNKQTNILTMKTNCYGCHRRWRRVLWEDRTWNAYSVRLSTNMLLSHIFGGYYSITNPILL